jgi:Phage terminase, small subunit.
MADVLPKRIDPPKHLSATARGFWRDLRSTHAIDSADQLLLLRACCEALDRCESARRLIASCPTGSVIADRFGQLRAHPAVAIERDARAQLIAAIKALGLAPDLAPP